MTDFRSEYKKKMITIYISAPIVNRVAHYSHRNVFVCTNIRRLRLNIEIGKTRVRIVVNRIFTVSE